MQVILMMDFVLVLVSISLIVFDLFVIMVYNEGIQLLLQKKRRWFLFFLLWMVILFFQTAFYSWLPGRIGAELSLFDGLIVLEDGALIRNLGYMIIAHYLGIGCGIAKYMEGDPRERSFKLEVDHAGDRICRCVLLSCRFIDKERICTSF